MDQALTAKIIRLVNSPYYGLRAEVTSARQAVTMLGFDTVKNLSICVSVVSACIPENDIKSGLNLDDLWQHSIATGVIAQLIAVRAGLRDPDTAFTAGVLHDIGKFVMNLTLRSDYGEAIEYAGSKGVYLHEAEKAMFDADHQYFGSCLATMWGFPEILTDVIKTHHGDPVPGGEFCIRDAVHLADRTARILRIGSPGDNRSESLEPDTFNGIGLDGDAAAEFLEEARTRVDEARDILNLLG
jgi:putative nucleotidyltransferase with HDIG domain